MKSSKRITMLATTILQVERLTRHFDGMKVIQDISLEITEGACVGLVGDNGCGKTSLLNILFGIDQPDTGHIRYKVKKTGLENITGWPAWRRARSGIHYYFQSPRTWKNLTVGEHVEAALSDGGQDGSLISNVHWLFSPSLRKRTWTRRNELLDLVGLLNREKDFADELSYGQAKLLNLAQLLACPKRRLFLLDEPSAGLSPTMSRKMLDLLKVIKSEGTSMLVVEHDTRLLGDIADVVHHLKDGELVILKGNDE